MGSFFEEIIEFYTLNFSNSSIVKIKNITVCII